MKKTLVLLILMLLTAPLQAVEFPNFGIDPNKWYEGFLIIEALQTVQEIAEQEIQTAVEETAKTYTDDLEKKRRIIETQESIIVNLEATKTTTTVLTITFAVTTLILSGVLIFR